MVTGGARRSSPAIDVDLIASVPIFGLCATLFEDAGLTELAVARPCFLDLRQVR